MYDIDDMPKTKLEVLWDRAFLLALFCGPMFATPVIVKGMKFVIEQAQIFFNQ